VELLEEKIYQLAERYGGLNAGEENGKRGYMLTFSIAYIRDFALDFGIVGESFETSVPWDRCLMLCKNVKDRVHHELRKRNIMKPALVSCRVTQTYDAGACVYFYFGFNYLDGHESDPVHLYEEIETAARDEILANGGSISHHHGVGKIRKKWLETTISQAGMEMMKAIKKAVDPKNIFANGNLI